MLSGTTSFVPSLSSHLPLPPLSFHHFHPPCILSPHLSLLPSPSSFLPSPFSSPTLATPSQMSLVHHCRSDEFQCFSGMCIPKSYKCDGDINCLEGEDEVCGPGGIYYLDCITTTQCKLHCALVCLCTLVNGPVGMKLIITSESEASKLCENI